MFHPINTYWQTRNPVAQALRPLSWVFCSIAKVRRSAYGNRWLKSQRLPVPVVIVGNITAGGTGKTPFVIWLANYLRTLGLQPGVLTRGYRGTAGHWPQEVQPCSDPNYVGDEAVLLARHCNCPVIAGPSRFIGGRLLVEKYGCNLVICDDGLQHYALQRDLEIVMVDGVRRLGNGLCLPAGPLREPESRLHTCDLIVVNGATQAEEFGITLQATQAVNLVQPDNTQPLEYFRTQKIVALAGVGNPGRFFAMLNMHGLQVLEYVFPDHHLFRMQDFVKFPLQPVLMTEKDAIKCERFIDDNRFWYVPVKTIVEPALIARLTAKLAPYLTVTNNHN